MSKNYKRGLEDAQRVVEEHEKQLLLKKRKEKEMLIDPKKEEKFNPDEDEQDTDEF